MAMRRDRMKKPETDENKKSNGNSGMTVSENSTVPASIKSIKDYGYMKLVNGKVIKLNWTETEKKTKKKTSASLKLFTIKCVDNLIEVN